MPDSSHLLPALAFPERSLVEACGILEQRQQPVPAAAAAVVGPATFLVFELDAIPVGQRLDRLREVESLGLLHEAEDVAAALAAEAVVRLLVGADREARRALLVKGTAADPAGADAAERRPGLDELDDVDGVADGVDRRLADQRHPRAKRSVMPAT